MKKVYIYLVGKEFRKGLAILMVTTILISLFQGMNLTEINAAQDVRGILENVIVTVKQDGSIIDVSDELNPDDDIILGYRFDVPVFGDPEFNDGSDPNTYVQNGDTAQFSLPDNLDIETDTANPINLMFNGSIVGVLTFVGQNAVVTFAPLVDDPGISEVFVSFDISMSYDKSGDGGIPGDYDIVILDKTYTLTVPERVINITGSKNGVIIGDNVRWTVEVQSEYDDNNAVAPLTGYAFFDDIVGVGEYVLGSVRIGTNNNYDTATPIEGDVDTTDDKIKIHTDHIINNIVVT